jgi:hypothetical protein
MQCALSFVSYSSLDEKHALALVDALEKRSIPCWIAKRDVKGGKNYADEIPGVIEAAPALVVVFSRHAASSEEVKKELQLASRLKVGVLPFRIENVQATGAFLYEFTTKQWIDAFDDWEKGVDALAAAIVERSNGTIDNRSTGEIPPEKRGVSFKLLGVGGALALAAAGAFVIIERPAALFGSGETTYATATERTPDWRPLTKGSNFVNGTKDDILVHKTPNPEGEVMAKIGPNQTLYFSGELPTIARATVDDQPWLKLETSIGPVFVRESGLRSLDVAAHSAAPEDKN